MPHHDKDMKNSALKGGWLNRKLRTQLAVLIILLECTVVLALVSHVITVPVPPEPMWTMTIGGPPVSAPSDVRQQATEKQRVADAADHAAKTEPFNPFAGIVDGVACGLPAEELPHDNADDASLPDGNMIIGADAAGVVSMFFGADAKLFTSSSIDEADDDSGTHGPETMSPQEFRERYGRVGDFGSTLQQLSLELGEEQKPDDVQEPPVLIMQGTGTLDNLPDEGGESGINVIIGDEDL